MRSLDGRLALTSRAIAYGDQRLTETATRARLENGELTIEQLDGRSFDGQVGFSGKLSVAAEGAPKLAGKLSLVDAKLSDLRRTPASVDLPEGILNLDLDVTAEGASQAEMIGSLGGTGTVKIRDGAVTGFDIDRIASRLDRADTQKELSELLTKSMASGQTRIDRIAGALQIDKGVIRTDDLTVTTPVADVTGKGSADLANWKLDLALDIRLTNDADLPAFGLTLAGPLDRPQRTLDAKALIGKMEQRASDGSPRKAAEVGPLTPNTTIVPVQPAPAR
jgi:AsmA protein